MGAGADTVLALYAPNDVNRRERRLRVHARFPVVLPATAGGVYTARVRHADAGASGPTTNYTVALREGFCVPDTLEGAGNNGPGDARPVEFGATVAANFCADPLNPGLGDQDWLTFNGVLNGKYR